jgi:hypothetical protein
MVGCLTPVVVEDDDDDGLVVGQRIF